MNAEVRKEFPILERLVRGKPLVYLDNAATTHKPRAVIEAISRFYREYNANVHRAIHAMGEEATEAYEGARQRISRFIGAPSERCIVFVKNASEAVNLAAYSWGLRNVGEGDEIVVTIMEHHSNFVPWQQLAKRQGARLRVAPVTGDGRLDLEAFQGMLNERTKIVAFTHASNVLGAINPVREMAEMARSVGAAVFVDGAQSAPHMPVDVEALGCDFFAFSAHKMCGPTGIGALYGRLEILESMDPFLFGGEMIGAVAVEESTWKEPPWKFEAGTPNIAGAIGFGAAVEYLESVGMEAIRRHETELVAYCIERLQEMDGVTLYGPLEERAGLISFNLDGVHPHDVAQVLDQEGVAVRAGHHCAQPLMAHFDVPATARASFYLYNTKDEVDRLIAALEKTKEFFSHVPG